MNWQALLEPKIQSFIKESAKSDLAKLALSKSLPEPRTLILDQIKSRTKAKRKAPQWLGHKDIIFPPPDIMEQASSEATALFKATQVQGKTFTDLTGGAGMDSWAFARHFEHGHIIEQNAEAAALIAHNLETLGFPHIKIHNADAENYAQTMQETDLVYIDPARRNATQRGIFRLDATSPDILALLPVLKHKAKTILIKTSPMLDIEKACEDLGRTHIHDIYVIEWQGECKELLFLLKPTQTVSHITLHAVTLNDNGTAAHHLTDTLPSKLPTPDNQLPIIGNYLYEPGPALQKSSLFEILSQQYGLHKIARDTHLFTTTHKIENFPGRSFKIHGLYEPRKKNLPFKQANLTIRNFPAHTPELLKKLGLKEGGEDYLFACTLHNGERSLIHCKR